MPESNILGREYIKGKGDILRRYAPQNDHPYAEAADIGSAILINAGACRGFALINVDMNAEGLF